MCVCVHVSDIFLGVFWTIMKKESSFSDNFKNISC